MRQVHSFPDGTRMEWSPTAAGYPGHSLDVSCPCGPWCLTDVDEGIQSVRHVEPDPDIREDRRMIKLADARSVPAAGVAALEELERSWPGATLPQARPAIVAAVMAALT